VSARSGPASGLSLARAKGLASCTELRAHGVSSWALGLAAIALAGVLATNLLDLESYRFGVRLLDANWEFSWSHDVDTLALAFGVLVAAAGATWHPRQRALWIATSVILALFFLDEVSPAHAAIGHVSKLLYVPIVGALAICLWRLADSTAEQGTVALGLATLLISFGMHVVGLTILRPIGYMTWPYQTGVGVKEGAELGGLLLLVVALFRLARGSSERRYPRRTALPTSQGRRSGRR
jgi:hypothetical protein